MYIIYCLTFMSFYWLGLEVFKPNWEKDEQLPILPRTNTSVVMGKYEDGYVYHNFKKFAHMILAGTTGYGKTNFIKCLISQLNGEIILIDLKGGFDYGRVTATDIVQARVELEQVTAEMKQRRQSHIYVIVDEAGELLAPAHLTRKESADYLACQSCVSEIARLGRGFHVHLIYATQYPTKDILSGQIKQNAETRICFRLPTDIASRVALDESGAEELPSGHYGMGIYKKDYKLPMKSYEFVERDGWDVKIRNPQRKGSQDTFQIE
ncbi:DNA translocase [Virgibacillus phage Mimir87]|nr:DNA translocase [Virgibacillus phage Mimir87]